MEIQEKKPGAPRPATALRRALRPRGRSAPAAVRRSLWSAPQPHVPLHYMDAMDRPAELIQHGDDFEKAYWPVLLEPEFPQYAAFWSRFVRPLREDPDGIRLRAYLCRQAALV